MVVGGLLGGGGGGGGGEEWHGGWWWWGGDLFVGGGGGWWSPPLGFLLGHHLFENSRNSKLFGLYFLACTEIFDRTLIGSYSDPFTSN